MSLINYTSNISSFVSTLIRGLQLQEDFQIWFDSVFSPHCHSFSTAYQCIYYSPEHTAKAQEVLGTMNLLQPLIASLVDQLLQAAQEHSSPGLKDALKNLSDKVKQPPNPPPTLTFIYRSSPWAAANLNRLVLNWLWFKPKIKHKTVKPIKLRLSAQHALHTINRQVREKSVSCHKNAKVPNVNGSVEVCSVEAFLSG